jgi:hypothetical protein
VRSSGAFYVFPKWKEAKVHAFGSQAKPSIVPPEDKAAYLAIFEELMAAANRAREVVPGGNEIDLKPMNYSPEYGSRGHRPVDLWVSLCGAGSEALAQMPQVYAIASERGLEIGFAVSIDEADYHDPAVKTRNRLKVPLLNAKLPGPGEALTRTLDETLIAQGGWRISSKTRLVEGDSGWDRFGSLAELFAALKGSGDATGGGTVCRTFRPDELAGVDVEAEFERALRNFLPLIARCAPTPWDVQIILDQDTVASLADYTPFDPASIVDARRMVLAAVARRQGQASFRNALFRAYDGGCAVTGTTVPAVLQAAHITPYLGTETNHVTNGLLLRADIHTLFDLGLLRIEPEALIIRVSAALRSTPYANLEGQVIAATVKASQRPSAAALRQHFERGPASLM